MASDAKVFEKLWAEGRKLGVEGVHVARRPDPAVPVGPGGMLEDAPSSGLDVQIQMRQAADAERPEVTDWLRRFRAAARL